MSIQFLLIDDDEDELFIFSTALNRINIDAGCSQVPDLHAATDLLLHLKPDYIFIDVNMPRINGFTCLSELKKLDLPDSCMLVMYSNGISDTVVSVATSKGAYACIRKTNNIEELVGYLQALLLQSGNLSQPALS